MTRIFLDAMGGDHAPGAACEGALLALRADPELFITLAGVSELILPLLTDARDVRDRLEVASTHRKPSATMSPRP